MATTRRREAGSGPPVRDSDAARAAEAVVDTPTLGGEATPLPTGAIVFTETQEDRDRVHRPVGAEPDVEGRFVALMQTDFRLQAEINGQKQVVETLQIKNAETDRLLDATYARVRALEEKVVALEVSQSPRSDLYRRLSSRKFLMALVAFIGAIVGGFSGWIPTEVAAVLATASAGLYGLAEAWVDNGTEKARAEVAKAEGAKAAASLRPPA